MHVCFTHRAIRLDLNATGCAGHRSHERSLFRFLELRNHPQAGASSAPTRLASFLNGLPPLRRSGRLHPLARYLASRDIEPVPKVG
jgi:hypothetical protein